MVHAQSTHTAESALDAYIWLMKTYAMQYNRAMVVQTYRTCERVLNREIGLPPMESTRHEYQALLDTQR